jgi:hypothetical protein
MGCKNGDTIGDAQMSADPVLRVHYPPPLNSPTSVSNEVTFTKAYTRIIDFIKKPSTIPYLCVGIFFYLLTYFQDVRSGDWQAVFHDQVVSGNFTGPVAYAVWKYTNWSSRFVVEFFGYFMTEHLLIWRIITIALAVLMVHSIRKCFGFIEFWQMSLVAIFFCLFIPSAIYSSAGIYAMVINYLWTSSLLLYALSGIRTSIYSTLAKTETTRIKISKMILYLLSLIFACNSEQMSVLAFMIFFLFNLVWFIKIKAKQFNLYIVLGLVISLLGIMNVLICPGNVHRRFAEIASNFPAYANISIFSKVNLGFLYICKHFLFDSDLVYLAIISVLLILSIRISISTNKKVVLFLLNFVPLIMSKYFYNTSDFFRPQISQMLGQMQDQFIPNTSFSNPKTLMPHIFFLFLIFCFVASIFLLYGFTFRTLFILYIAFSGFIATFLVSFSPSIYASDVRIFFPLYITLLCVLCYLSVDLVKNCKAHKLAKLNSRHCISSVV